jgi:FMN phosphatase YigB (HAD superfamily)
MGMTRPHIIVVDLDGTLCNSRHREHLAIAKQWDEFHSLLRYDEPWDDVKRFLSELHADIEVIGLTGRNERYRNETLDWLDTYEICLSELLMRPDDNYQPDHELKPQMLAAAGVKPQQVWLVLEDRDKVVEAWRNLGFSCWQVRPGGY